METLRSPRFDPRTLAGAILTALIPGLAGAGPTGEQVVGGSAQVGRPDGATTVITQTSAHAIINWQQFNIAGSEFVQFLQPSSSAVVLNRVIGGSPSEIFGSIAANGRVFLINPNGVMFAPGARLDVAGLVATTFAIADDDFMAGDYRFARAAGAPEAGVVNRGVLQTADGGFIVLAGDFASNDGVIAAPAGTVVLASGARVALNLDGAGLVDFAVDEPSLSAAAGVRNSGQILADGGTVVMTARVANQLVGTAVNNSGLIRAARLEDRGGEVWLTASGGDAVNSGTLDASGADGDGGRVIVYSDRDTVLTGTIRADGTGSGAGGSVRAIAAGTLVLDDQALISARGGSATTAAGGMVEVSGHGTLHLRGEIDVGTGGAILIDPSSVILTGGTSPPTSAGLITVGFISTQLGLGNDVKIIASNFIGASTGSLSIVSTNAAGDLMLEIGTTAPLCEIGGFAGFCTSPPAFPVVTLVPGGSINLSGVMINIVGSLAIDALGGTVNLGNVRAGAIAAGGSAAPLATFDADKLTALSGNVSIHATDAVSITTIVEANAGDVVIRIDNGSGGATLNAGAIGAGDAIDVSVVTASGSAMINVGGNITAGAALSLTALSEDGRAAMFIGGDLTAVGALAVSAEDLAGSFINTSLNVNGNVAGQTVDLSALSQHNGGNVSIVGSLTATGGGVTVIAHGVGAASPAGMIGINGAVTANGQINLEALDTGGGGGGVVSAASVSGTDITISAIDSGAGSGAGGGQVFIGSGGSTFFGGAITATGNLSITVRGTRSSAGMLIAGQTTVGGSITIDVAGGPGGGRVWFVDQLGSGSPGAITGFGTVTVVGDFTVDATGDLDLAGDITAANIDLTTTGQFFGSGTLTAGDLLLDGAAGITDFAVVTNVAAITVDGANSAIIDNVLHLGAATITLAGTSPDLLDVKSGGTLTLAGTFSGTTLTLDATGLDLGTAAHAATGAMSLITNGSLAADGRLIAGTLTLDAGPTSAIDLAVTTTSVSVIEAGDVQLDLGTSGTTATIAFGPTAAGTGTFGDVRVTADGGLLLLSGIDAQSLELIAGGDIGVGCSCLGIDAGALFVEAGGSINFGGVAIAIGTGGGQFGVSDAPLLNALQFAGIAPSQTFSSGTFLAAGSLSLGPVTSTGSYLVLQGDSLSLSGPISGPTDLLVQIAPATANNPIFIEQTGGGTAGGTSYSISGQLDRISAATLVIGASTYSGPVTIGVNGPVDVTPRNFVVATGGTIDSLGNVTSTGLVASLADLLIASVVLITPPAIIAEIDPSLADPAPPVDTEAGLADDEDDEEGEDTGADGSANPDDAGLVTQESAPAGVCSQ